jgi:hypothetical protein
MGFKIIRVIIMNLENFGENFHDFWMKGAIKINWEKKVRSIRGLKFNQGALRVQLGIKDLTGCKLGMLTKGGGCFGIGERILKKRKMHELGSPWLSLIKPYMWVQITCT